MKKIKLEELESMLMAIKNISTKEIPGAIAFKFLDLQEILSSKYETFIKSRKMIFDKYGEEDKDKDGNKMIKIKKEFINDANKEIKELAETEIEIDININRKELEKLNFSIQDLYPLRKVITKGE